MEDFEKKIARLLQKEIPFFFITDFLSSRKEVYTFSEAASQNIFFNIKGITNAEPNKFERASTPDIDLKPNPVPFKTYQTAFNTVKTEILNGNSFLLNLTYPTAVETSVDLKTIYQKAEAPYKLLYKNEFVVFSPECYLKFKNSYVYSYPMKGTISSKVPNAMETLLSNKKELYEHNTIVDLVRNDLSMIANEISVTKFRYIEFIKKRDEELLQTSTEIRGKLPTNWKQNFASLLLKTLPAGSISGAPKAKTLSIIQKAEKEPRGFYTGVFGFYDGKTIDSAVSIRFIEKKGDQYYYRSGGGITHLSTLEEEYQELIAKIYVPII